MEPLPQEILLLAENLIRFKTVKDNPLEIRNCINFIKEYFSSSKVVVQEFESSGKPSIIISYPRGIGSTLLLNGHIDVVEGEEKQFNPQIKDGRLYGRGAVDMKSGVAVIMFLMKEFADKMPPISLMIVSDEEIGGLNGTSFLINQGHTGRFVLAPEPNQSLSVEKLDIIIAEKGVLWLEIKTFGKSCHGSRPWLGENAIEKLIKIYQQIKLLFPETTGGDHWKNTMNLGKISGGNAPNSVPAEAEMVLDIRYTEETEPEEIIAKIQEIPDLNVIVLEKTYPLSNDKDTPEILQLKACAEKITNEKVNLIQEHGSSDLRFFSEKGIPAVIFGPKGGNHHGKDEFVYLSSLNLFYRTVQEFIFQSYFSPR